MTMARALLSQRINSSSSAFSSELDTVAATHAPRRDASVPLSLRSLCKVSRTHVNDRPVLRLTPRVGTTQVDVMYLHGGGYILPIGYAHWWIIEGLIRMTGASVTVPLYGLAPEHTVDDAIPMLDSVYQDVAARGTRLILAGDSAGGALALAQAMRARNAGWRPASSVLLLSPWVDATVSNPYAKAMEVLDPMLRCDGSAACGRWWAGRRDPRDPMVSPINDSLRDLPPLAIYMGHYDLLMPDALLLTYKARLAGTAVHLVEAPDGFHLYMAAPGTSEAQQFFYDAAAHILGNSFGSIYSHATAV